MVRLDMVISMTRCNEKTVSTASWIADGALSGEPVMVVCDSANAAQRLAAEAQALGAEATAVVAGGQWVVKAKPCRLSAVG